MEATGTGSQSDTEADGIPLVILLRHRLPARHKGCYTCFQGGISLKKLVILLLVAAMVLGSLVGVFMYAGFRDQTQEGPFADVPAPVIGSYRFADFRGADLSKEDFKVEPPGMFYTFTFDTSTKWPHGEKTPDADLAREILEKGKYPGLGLSSLLQEGITGRGVHVAVIDKPIAEQHRAFARGLNYIEVSPEHPNTGRTHFHGAAVAGILSGQYGVAPESGLYYFAVPDDTEPYARYAEAMEKILELQDSLPGSAKIRVVAIAHGLDPADVATNAGGAKDWSQAIDKARQQGIIVIYPGMPGLSFTGTGCPPGKDRDNPENYELWSWTRVKQEIAGKLESHQIRSWDDARTMLIRLLTQEKELDSLQAEAINTFIYIGYVYKNYLEFDQWLDSVLLDDPGQVLAIPADYLTVPNVAGPDEYTYYGAGGLSWSTGYLAGLVTLGLQVKPDATEQEIFEALWQSSTPFYGQSRLANPIEYISTLTGD